MALTGWSSTKYLQLASAPVSDEPLTLACWFSTPNKTSFQNIFGIYAGTENRNCFKLNLDSSSKIRATTGGSSDEGVATTSVSFATDTWTFAGGVFAANNSRKIYSSIDSVRTETSTRTQSNTPAYTTIGAGGGTSISVAMNAGALVAECAAWDAALTDDEMAALIAGFSAELIRPQNRVFYAPLVRELVNLHGSPLTMNGSLAQADHPRIYGA